MPIQYEATVFPKMHNPGSVKNGDSVAIPEVAN